jgi:hypothetical protein
MRAKKRYILTRTYPRNLPDGCEFLYQDRTGFVFKVPLEAIDDLSSSEVILKSGSVRKIKQFSKQNP